MIDLETEMVIFRYIIPKYFSADNLFDNNGNSPKHQKR